MSRTLVISDLHIGCRVRASVLEQPEPLELLLAELEHYDRLVLLGDALELIESRPAHSLDAAEPILRAIGARLGSGREVVFVPGNHDRELVRDWVRNPARELRADTEVPLDASPALADIASWLGPARVTVHYPGVWLRDGVWATHGHFLDQHLLPVSTYGMARGLLSRLPRDVATPLEYELSIRPQLSRALRRMPHPLAALFDDLAELLRASTMPRIHRRVLHPRIAPLTARLLGTQMRRASLPALGRVVHRIGVDADWVVFGHVHRLGPLAGDDPAQWSGPGGRPRLVNTGSWLYEPLLVHRARPPHPYWPGGAVVLEDGSAPRAIGLLDGLSADDLH